MKTLLVVLIFPLLALGQPALGQGRSADRSADRGAVCGGFAGVRCAPGNYCDWPANRCAAADVQGRCVRVPEVCTEVYQPVCGCNGQTYSNDCARLRARAQKAHDGAC